jgi:hypothetical protein
MLKDLDTVALTRSLDEFGLTPGDVGTIVHVYPEGQAYEVEFMTLGGDTLAVVTLEAGAVRPVGVREIAHTREVA